MSEKRIRVAVIGAGGIARTAHIPAYLSNKYAELVAVVDPNPEPLRRVAKKFKVKKTYLSVDDLLENEEIDAISICTPPNSHAEIALKGFQHGVHVLCEKPLSTDVESGKEMVSASKNKGKILMTGFHRRYQPNYQNAKKQIKNGSLGHVYCVEDHFIEPNPLYSYSKSTWLFQPGIGGALVDAGPHIFDMLNYIFDDYPIAISAQASTYLDQKVEDSCYFILEYSQGRVGIGVASWLSCKYVEKTTILGTAQNLTVAPNYFLKENSNEFSEISLLRAAGESLVTMKMPHLPFMSNKYADPYQAEINHFIDCVRKNTPLSETAIAGLSVLMATDAAKTAIATGCRVEIPSLDQQ